MNIYLQLTPEQQAQLKEQVLISVQRDQPDGLRRKVARNFIDDDGNNQWPDFLRFLFECDNSPAPALKESALRMFT
jgi:importin-5